MTNPDLKTCVINCETIREQILCRHWDSPERAALVDNLRIAAMELSIARGELLGDGFSLELVDTMQQQFVMEYMEGNS